MPKRVIDGDALWRSDKLAKVEPAWMRAEFANLIPLALANGSFECNPRLIWSRVYSYNRPEVTIEQVTQVLAELERVKLLFRWKDAAGKEWGYWVGIEKTGRLPAKSRLDKGHETLGCNPPVEALAEFLGTDQDSSGQPMASHSVANGCLGFGFGFGSGLGLGSCTPGSDQRIFEIAKAYPKLSHLRDETELSPLVADAIIQAVEKDGDDVLRGTKGAATAIKEQYLPKPVDFYREFKYRQFLTKAETHTADFYEKNSPAFRRVAAATGGGRA